MKLSDHVVRRWLERVRGINPAKVVTHMKANGWHGMIGEDDCLWWLENKLGLDIAQVRAEIATEFSSSRFAGPSDRNGVRMRTPICEFIAVERQGNVDIVTVLPARATTVKPN